MCFQKSIAVRILSKKPNGFFLRVENCLLPSEDQQNQGTTFVNQHRLVILSTKQFFVLLQQQVQTRIYRAYKAVGVLKFMWIYYICPPYPRQSIRIYIQIAATKFGYRYIKPLLHCFACIQYRNSILREHFSCIQYTTLASKYNSCFTSSSKLSPHH